METIKLTTHIQADGKLTLDLPKTLINRQVEILVVLQPITNGSSQADSEPVDEMGYPLGFWEKLHAMGGDDLMERPDQGFFDEREPFE